MCVFQSPVRRMRIARSMTCGSSMPTAWGTPAVRNQSRAAAAAARIRPIAGSLARRRREESPAEDMQGCTRKISFADGPRLHHRRRGGIPDRRPGHMGAAIACLPAPDGQRPLARGSDQARTPPVHRRSRHENLRERGRAGGRGLPHPARSLLIFGLHIHVAVPDRASTIELLNEARYFLPHLLALSTSSPFWQGRDTGLKSYRTAVFRRFPRSGIPDQFDSWSEYEAYLDMLVELHCIDNGKKIWWDLRPHPVFGTLEFRICDVPTSPRVTVALAALAQALVVKLYRLRKKNLGFRIYSRALIEENKWRAARYGIDGRLIDFGRRTEEPMRDLALELLEFVDDVAGELGSRKALDYVRTIIAEGTSADRQLQVYRETGDLRAVVRWLVEQTRASNKEV